jgi:hypothetical protein
VFLSVVEYLLSLKVLVKPCLKRIVAALWCISPFAAFFLWSADCSCLFFSRYTIFFFSRVCQKKNLLLTISTVPLHLRHVPKDSVNNIELSSFQTHPNPSMNFRVTTNHGILAIRLLSCYTLAVSLITLPQALSNYG